MPLGDFTPGKVVRFGFCTHKADGTPITLAGTPAVSVYKDAGTTESTSGVTLTVDFDSRTGSHLVAIDTSADGTFYSAGSDFRAVLTAGTVDSISVVGTVIESFSLSNRSALRPTVADRTLDVSSGGEAGIDWANVGGPTTSLALTATTISSSQVAASVTGNVDGNVTGSVGSVAGAVGSVTGGVGGSVASVASGGITAASFAADAITAAKVAADVGAEVASAVRAELATELARLDAAVTSRMASYTQPAGFLAATFPPDPADQSLVIAATDALLAAIQALNDLSASQVQSAAADALAAYDPPTSAEMEARTLASASYATASALSTLAGYVDTEVAAVKGVTDKLDTALELDGSAYRFTENALEQAPSGGGGGGGATAAEVWEYGSRTLTSAANITSTGGATATQTGDAFARLGAPAGASIAADLATIDAVADAVIAKLNASGATFTLASTVPAAGGRVRLVRGDDYDAADGRDLVWNLATTLDLSGASVTLSVRGGPDGSSALLPGYPAAVSFSAAAGGYTLRRGLTAAQTAALPARGLLRYELDAALASGRLVTLLSGLIETSG